MSAAWVAMDGGPFDGLKARVTSGVTAINLGPCLDLYGTETDAVYLLEDGVLKYAGTEAIENDDV